MPSKQQTSPLGQLAASEQFKVRPWQVVPFCAHVSEPPPPGLNCTQQIWVAELHVVWPHAIGAGGGPASTTPLDPPDVLVPLDPPEVPLDEPPDVPDAPLLELAAPLDDEPLALPLDAPPLGPLLLAAPPSSSG